MRGEMFYRTKNLSWRIDKPHTWGAWYATITDAVPIGLKQPQINRRRLEELIVALDDYTLEPAEPQEPKAPQLAELGEHPGSPSLEELQ